MAFRVIRNIDAYDAVDVRAYLGPQMVQAYQSKLPDLLSDFPAHAPLPSCMRCFAAGSTAYEGKHETYRCPHIAHAIEAALHVHQPGTEGMRLVWPPESCQCWHCYVPLRLHGEGGCARSHLMRDVCHATLVYHWDEVVRYFALADGLSFAEVWALMPDPVSPAPVCRTTILFKDVLFIWAVLYRRELVQRGLTY